MLNHESHARHPHGHDLGHHGPGHGKMGGPLQALLVNTIITQAVARVCMVVGAIALVKIASSMALGARVKMMKELREDLSEEQRTELLDDIWRRAHHKRICCSHMLPCCSPGPGVKE